MTDHHHTLILCRTPLQARICLRIIELEGLQKPDVLYFTQNDSETDRLYFDRLSAVAGHTQYLHVPIQRADVLNHLRGYLGAGGLFKRRHYANVYLASFDSPFFRAMLKHQPQAVIRTFDDGTSNILGSGPFSYHTDGGPPRAAIYERLAGLKTAGEIRNRSDWHYSIYKGFKNICPPEKTTFLDIFPTPCGNDGRPGSTFFIGQPFHEYLTPEQIGILKDFLLTRHFDFYVPHPRESRPLIAHAPLLDKQGELAEVAIMRAAGQGIPSIYSCFSTVLINIPEAHAKKYYLSLPGDAFAREMLDLVMRTGCRVIDLWNPAKEGASL